MLFGPPQHRLLGVWHAPAAGLPVQIPVLLCNAFGHEASRAHRMWRVVADRLARAGHGVLRFDYHGSGDSPGDDLAGDLEVWADDVLIAERHLRDCAGASSCQWMGMRLGANVAWRAARKAAPVPHRLILWDPIVDGAVYAQFLRQRQAQSLRDAYGPMPVPVLADSATGPRGEEWIGTEVSARLRQQVEQERWPEAQELLHVPALVLLCEAELAAHPQVLAQASRGHSRWHVVPCEHGTDWTTDTAVGNLVVNNALEHLLAAARGQHG